MAENGENGDMPTSPNDMFDRQGEADLNRQQMAETDRKYVKFKMKEIKKAMQNGNRGRAERLRVELLQYLGMI